MRKVIFTSIAVLALAASAVASSAAFAATSNAPLIVAMKDPGCHWFYTGGGPNHRRYTKTVTRVGPVTLLNLDEAALIVKGPASTKTLRVGTTLRIAAKGTYRITMVKQEPDDNTLTLKVT